MRWPTWILGTGALLLLAGCADNGPPVVGGHPSGTGPFDSQGRYHEEWADNPPSRGHARSSSSSSLGPSLLAKNEEIRVAPQSVPPPAAPSSKTRSSQRVPEPPPPPPPTAKKGTKSPASPPPAVAKNEPKSSSSGSSSTAKSSSKSRATSSEVASAEAKPKPKTKPKTSVASRSKKSSSGSLRVTVKHDDTLWGLAKRHHTTVDAIKKANNLSSDLIRDGKTLVIPRKSR